MSDWLGTVGRLASASAAHCSAGCWHPPWLQVSPLREATTLPEQQQVVDRARVCNAGEEEVVVHTRGRSQSRRGLCYSRAPAPSSMGLFYRHRNPMTMRGANILKNSFSPAALSRGSESTTS